MLFDSKKSIIKETLDALWKGNKMKRNIRLTLAYDGSRYDGWQKQGNTKNTIQGRIEAALERMAGEEIELHGSGRTDAGVHARGQEANFYTDCTMESGKIRDYLNRYLPEDIAVLEAREEAERFHARLWAVEKEYIYRIWNSSIPNVFQRKYMYKIAEPLDLDKMEEAARLLLGEHDFKSFCANKRMKKSTVRSLNCLDIEQQGREIKLRYRGNGFLYHMVRIMTGTLIEVGLGKRKPEEVKEILEKRDRQEAGYLVPPEGLCLEQVFYLS